jgi:hypothetical protein
VLWRMLEFAARGATPTGGRQWWELNPVGRTVLFGFFFEACVLWRMLEFAARGATPTGGVYSRYIAVVLH